MIYMVATKRGLGLEIWGTYDDLNSLYELISKFWADEDKLPIRGSENRDKLISSFSYELRKAHKGSRLKRKRGHFSCEEQEYLGTQMSWVHFLFSLTALKYNMSFYEINKLEISIILQLEFWLEKAMNSYDEAGAKKLSGFIDGAIYGANDYIYHYMRSINYEFFLLGGGKRSFRMLPDILKRGVFSTDEYHEYESFLNMEAERLKCGVNDIEIDDDDDVYFNVKW